MEYLPLLSFLGLRVQVYKGDVRFSPRIRISPPILSIIIRRRSEIINEIRMINCEAHQA